MPMCLGHEFLGNLVEESPILQLLLGSIALNLLLFVVPVTWRGYNSGRELWSTVDALMSTVDVRMSTPTSVDVGASTCPIRKVNAPMSTVDAPRSTLIASVQSEVNAQATMSTRRRRPKVYKSVCACVYTYTHTHTNTHSHTHNPHTYTYTHTHT